MAPSLKNRVHINSLLGQDVTPYRQVLSTNVSENRSAFFWDVKLYREVISNDVSEDSSASSGMLHGVDKHLPTSSTIAMPSSSGTNSP